MIHKYTLIHCIPYPQPHALKKKFDLRLLWGSPPPQKKIPQSIQFCCVVILFTLGVENVRDFPSLVIPGEHTSINKYNTNIYLHRLDNHRCPLPLCQLVLCMLGKCPSEQKSRNQETKQRVLII